MKIRFYIFAFFACIGSIQAQFHFSDDSLGISVDFPCSEESIVAQPEELSASGIITRSYTGEIKERGEAFSMLIMLIPRTLASGFGEGEIRKIFKSVESGLVKDRTWKIRNRIENIRHDRGMVELSLKGNKKMPHGRSRFQFSTAPFHIQVILLYVAPRSRDMDENWERFRKSLVLQGY